MKHTSIKFALIAAGMFAAALGHAQAAYQFSDLGNGYATGINDHGQIVGSSSLGATLWTGSDPVALSLGTGGYASAINNAGQIVGATVFHGVPLAALWNGPLLTNLDPIGGGITYANGINGTGQVVGACDAGAMTWNGGTPTNLNINNGFSYVANGISNGGTIVGNAYSYDSGNTIATAWSGSKVTVLPSLGGSYSDAYAVNNAGVIVGSSTNTAGTMLAVEWRGANATALGSLGGITSSAYAINGAGQVVGSSTNAAGANLATLWKGTTAINLNNLLNPAVVQEGWVLTAATGINNEGWIVGDAVNAKTGASDAFLLAVSPVPEAGGYVMMLVGLCMIGGLMLFRRRLNPPRRGRRPI
jgi:probable HAF family extracellular repeat protein